MLLSRPTSNSVTIGPNYTTLFHRKCSHFKMEGDKTCGSKKSIGFIRCKKYSVFEQCYMYCLENGIDYHSCHHTVENINPDKDFTLHFVYLFTFESASDVIIFMEKLKMDYVFVNIIAG